MATRTTSKPLLPAAPIALGPFVLERKVGLGGMAEVWRGMHVRQKVPVAIKVVHAHMAKDPAFVTAFRNEVLSVARLQHPRIIMVLDQGVVDADAEKSSGGAITAGSPFLAMELATGGTLLDIRPPLDWATLRATLLAVMDALAHAHARGVIHRDLKPNNVLLCTPSDTRQGIKLSDFGLACPSDRALDIEREDHIAGTPQFMAPEQFRGEWRDYGPWTDLYALGCMAYYFSCGELPFDGTLPQLIEAHLNQAPPEPLLLGDLPGGLVPWMLRLMEKDPRARFDCVADAAHALLTLTGERNRSSFTLGAEVADVLDNLVLLARQKNAPPAPIPSAQVTVAAPHTPGPRPREDKTGLLRTRTAKELALFTEPSFRDTIVDQLPAAAAVPNRTAEQVKLATLAWDSRDRAERTQEFADPSEGVEELKQKGVVPPLPRTWRRDGGPLLDLKLIGAGLGLYGVRSVPLVDRDAARDVVWNTLRAVHDTGRAHVVVLRGSAGHGKSRVAEWICQRMLEVGGATVLRAVHGSNPGPGQGLGRMWSVNLGCSGLTRESMVDRLEVILRAHGVEDPYEWNALAELVAPSVEGSAQRAKVVFGSSRERYALMRRQLQRMSRRRPVTCWMDDVQWGADALALVTHVMETQDKTPFPALFLLTVQEEGLSQQPQETRLLESLCATAGVHVVHVPALSKADHRQLVGELLGLEGDLAVAVAERTAGNPLFAVQLVGDWVQRGLLQVGSRGFALRRRDQAQLPDNIHQVWTARLAQLPNGQTPRVRAALELASVLGMDVDINEWSEACALAGAADPMALVEPLVANRLMLRSEGSLRFIHGMLRESIERSAREGNRLAGHHGVAAAVLQPRLVERFPGVAQRLGRHLLEAGRLEDALEPLLLGAREHLRLSEYPAAHAVLDQVADVAARLNLGAGDERRGEAWVLRAQVYVEEHRFEEASEYADLADQGARAHGWVKVGAAAAAVLGHVAYQHGDTPASREALLRARTAYEQVKDAQGIAQSILGLGDAAYQAGDFDGADALYKEALVVAQKAGDLTSMAKSLWGQGYVRMHRGNTTAARACFERQLILFDRAGSQYGRAISHNALGEAARLEGRFVDAVENYRKSLDITDAIGAGGRTIINLNLVLCLLQQGSFAAARKELDRIWAAVEASDQVTTLLGGWGMQAACAAHERHWDLFDAQLERMEDFLQKHPMYDSDTALELLIAGEQAGKAGDRARARRAFAISRSQWEGLGREERVTQVDRALAAWTD